MNTLHWLPEAWHWDIDNDPNLSFLEQNYLDEELPLILIYLTFLLSQPLQSLQHLKLVEWIEHHFHPICETEEIQTRNYYFGLIGAHQTHLHQWFKTIVRYEPSVAYHFFEEWITLYFQQKISIADVTEVAPYLTYHSNKYYNDFIILTKAIVSKCNNEAFNYDECYQYDFSNVGESILQYLHGKYPDPTDENDYEISPMFISLICLNSSPKDIQFIENVKKIQYWKQKKESKNNKKQCYN